MIRVDTMGVYHFEIAGYDAVQAAETLQAVLGMMYQDGFDICETLPKIRLLLEDVYHVSIIAKF